MKSIKNTLALVSLVSALGVMSGCGGTSDEAATTPIDISTIPDTLFAAGIDCRNPGVSDYRIWDTPYRELTCFGGPEGGPGDWSIHVMVLGSEDDFYGVLSEYCGGRETTSSGGFTTFEEVAMGPNWIAHIETTSATDKSRIPSSGELAAALGGQRIASREEACTIAQENSA